MFSTSDTIVAIATAQGRGGIGIVRLSGPNAPQIAATLLGRSTPLEPRHATYAHIREVVPGEGSETSHPVDQVIATYFAAPRSYTGEDVVEISSHGSPVLLRRVVELATMAGARLAEPGEFTFRAYLNDRIDLVQAEAVADLIEAVTPLQARVAMDQLEGTLSGVIGAIQSSLFDLIARLEASLDFPDEGFHFVTLEETAAALSGIRANLERLAADGRAGRLLREGSLVVIVGPPNAGKSSLFNALAAADRAIVTPLPGTTRDVLTERIDVNGLPITLVDTAGLRDAGDAVEAEGVRRARQAREVAAMTLFILDGSRPLSQDDRALLADTRDPTVVVVNKSDLASGWCDDDWRAAGPDPVRASAVTGEGLNQLRASIVRTLTGRDDWRDPPAISNARHLARVREALAAVETGEAALAAGGTEEMIVAELHVARRALETVTGRTTDEDLLRHIFGRFCVGK
jgi:tRNA modification GTPase